MELGEECSCLLYFITAKQGANHRANAFASMSSLLWWQAWWSQVPLLSSWVTVCQSIFCVLHFDMVTVWVKTEKLQWVILAELSQIKFYIHLLVYPLTYSNLAYFFFLNSAKNFSKPCTINLVCIFSARDDVDIFHGPQPVFIRVRRSSSGWCDFKMMHVRKRYHSDYSLPSFIYFLPVILGGVGCFLHALLLFTFFPLKLLKLSCCYLVLLDPPGQQWLPRVEESVLKFWRGKFNQQSNHFCCDGKKKEEV